MSVPDAVRSSMASALSESNMLAGRLAFFDLQQPEIAQASYVLGLQAAQDARDPLLASAVLAHMAFIPAFSGAQGRAEEAREKVRAARAFAHPSPAWPTPPDGGTSLSRRGLAQVVVEHGDGDHHRGCACSQPD